MKHRLTFQGSGCAILTLLMGFLCPVHAQQKRQQALRAAAAADPPAHVAAGVNRSAVAHSEYVIGAGDVLAIDVWQEPEVSRVEPVRPDDKITLPLAGEIEAGGETTGRLEAEIARRLANYIHQPAVTVIVQEANSHRFNVIGDVLRPGSYPLGTRMNVLDALAVAGGFGEFADVTHIYVVRRQADGNSARIPFNYKAAVRGEESDLNLDLLPGDTIIVP
jgi:polysaccharide biosynthesis/export protein